MADALDKRHLVENVFSLGHGAEPVAGIGILRNEMPIIRANGTTLMLASTILVAKLRFG